MRQKRGVLPRAFLLRRHLRHCEERSDEAIHLFPSREAGLLRSARNDGGNKRISHLDLLCDMSSEWFQIAPSPASGSSSTIARGCPAGSSVGSRLRRRQSLRAQRDAAPISVAGMRTPRLTAHTEISFWS